MDEKRRGALYLPVLFVLLVFKLFSPGNLREILIAFFILLPESILVNTTVIARLISTPINATALITGSKLMMTRRI